MYIYIYIYNTFTYICKLISKLYIISRLFITNLSSVINVLKFITYFLYIVEFYTYMENSGMEINDIISLHHSVILIYLYNYI